MSRPTHKNLTRASNLLYISAVITGIILLFNINSFDRFWLIATGIFVVLQMVNAFFARDGFYSYFNKVRLVQSLILLLLGCFAPPIHPMLKTTLLILHLISLILVCRTPALSNDRL